MQNLICWFVGYENMIALGQYLFAGFVLVICWIFESLTFIGLAEIAIACVLVFVTRSLVKVTRQRPFVICTVQRGYANNAGLKFIIRNTGNATAFYIEARVKAYKETPTGVKELKLNREFKLSILAPNQGYITLDGLKGLMNPMKFDIKVSWKSKIDGKRNKPLKYTIDNNGEDKGGWHEGQLDQITEEIAEVSREIANIRKNENKKNKKNKNKKK